MGTQIISYNETLNRFRRFVPWFWFVTIQPILLLSQHPSFCKIIISHYNTAFSFGQFAFWYNLMQRLFNCYCKSLPARV